eukprot:3538996-Prymnesium_polylepis.3
MRSSSSPSTSGTAWAAARVGCASRSSSGCGGAAPPRRRAICRSTCATTTGGRRPPRLRELCVPKPRVARAWRVARSCGVGPLQCEHLYLLLW